MSGEDHRQTKVYPTNGTPRKVNIHDVYDPFLRHFRTKRMQQFVHRFGVTGATKILDIGGSALNWSLIPIRPRLTIVNVLRPTKDDKELTWVVGNGRHFAVQAQPVRHRVQHLRDRNTLETLKTNVPSQRRSLALQNCITCRRRIVGFPLNLILLCRLSISSPNRYKSIS